MTWSALDDRYRGHHYDRTGQPITFSRWGELRSQLDYVRVAEDVAGRYVVVTNWLGQPTAVRLGAPHIFETYTVRRRSGEATLKRSYATEAGAIRGHREVVRVMRASRALLLAAYAMAIVIVCGVAPWAL